MASVLTQLVQELRAGQIKVVDLTQPLGPELLPPAVLHVLPAASQAHLLGKSFFPNVITSPFLLGLHVAFYLSAAICLIAALASLLRGKRYVYGSQPANATTVQDVVVAREEAPSQGD